MGSCGPGTLHLLNGLYESGKNGASVLCLATQIPKDEIGTRYVQETDPMRLFRDCSVYCEYVQSVEQLPRILGIAMQTAVARKGVAVVVIPGDISSSEVPGKFNLKYIPHYAHPVILPDDALTRQFADALNTAKRVTIVTDTTCAESAKALKALAAKLKAPLIWTLQSKEQIAFENPFPAGCMDLFCNTYPTAAIKEADLLLIAGMRHAPDELFDTTARIVQLDEDGAFLGHNHWVDLAVIGTAPDTLAAAMPLVEENPDTDFVDGVVSAYLAKQDKWQAIAQTAANEQQQIRPEYVMELINKKAPQDACFTADTGSSVCLTGAFIQATASRRFFQSSIYGSSGNALPMALGAAASVKDRAVIALCGDGGLAMLLGDLLTVVQMKLNIKILVLNNACYEMPAVNMVIQNRQPIDTSLYQTDYAAIASGLGISSRHVDKAEDLPAAIDAWLQVEGAALLDVAVASVSDLSLYLPETH